MKISKKASGFIKPPPKEFHAPKGKGIRCGTCKYYSATAKKCALVCGKIEPQACCNLWANTGRPKTDFSCGQDIEDILSGNEYF